MAERTGEQRFNQRVEELTRETGDHRVARDLAQAELIPEAERCRRCDGTGNELLYMFRCCKACGGSGKSRGNEDQFDD